MVCIYYKYIYFCIHITIKVRRDFSLWFVNLSGNAEPCKSLDAVLSCDRLFVDRISFLHFQYFTSGIRAI